MISEAEVGRKATRRLRAGAGKYGQRLVRCLAAAIEYNRHRCISPQLHRRQRLRGSMGIYRVKSFATISVGSGGRITIPQDMREEMNMEDGDTLTVRLEESQLGERQMTIWKAEPE
jgi:hypothetical protein